MYHSTVDINKEPSPYTTKQPVCLGRSRTRASGQVKVLAPAIRALKDRFREKKTDCFVLFPFPPQNTLQKCACITDYKATD